MMINESSNSSIAFAEAKGEAVPEKTNPLRDTIVSERSIKFQADGASVGENEPDTITSVSIHLESENPHSANSHNHCTSVHKQGSKTPSHDIQTESLDDIHFDTAGEPAPSSVQSVRFQVEGSMPASKVNRGTSPAPTAEAESVVEFVEETPQQRATSTSANTQHLAADTAAPAEKVADDVELDVASDEEVSPPTQAKPRTGSVENSAVTKKAPANIPPSLSVTFLPPRHLPSRAATAARTPRTNGTVPVTPRTRSSNSSYRPAASGVPPLAPLNEETQVERVAAATKVAAKPQSFDRNATDNSEFSSVVDPDAHDDAAAVVASVPTPTSPNIVVTNHRHTFTGPGWVAVVDTSRDIIERTVGNETAEATGVEAQFVRVTSIEANEKGMSCEMNIGHAPGQSKEQIDAAIEHYGYDSTRMLLGFVTSRGEPVEQQKEAEEADKVKPAIPFSFSEKVGEGLIVLNYSVFPFGSHRHLELTFDSPISAVSIKFVKDCLSKYLGMHESQLVVRRGDEVLADNATGADLGLRNGCTLEAQCTISQQQETEDTEDPLQATRQQPVASRNAGDTEEAEAEQHDHAAAAPAAATAHEEACEEPQQTVPVPTPAPHPKKATATKKKVWKKSATAAAAPAADAPAKKKATSTRVAKDAPAKKNIAAAARDKKAQTKPSPAAKPKPAVHSHRHYETARGQSFAPHYATPIQNTTNEAFATTITRNATPQLSTARSYTPKTPLPRIITTSRVYRAHSPRPGAESLEEGETMTMYMSASRSPSRDGTHAHSSRISVSRKSSALQPISAAPPLPSRRAASIVVTRRSSADSRALSTSALLPPQHTVRGVASVAFRPRPVIQVSQPQQPHGHSRSFLHNVVEHQADTHSASIRSHSPQQLTLDADRDDASSSSSESVDYVVEDAVPVTEEAAAEKPMEVQVYKQHEVALHAEVPAAQTAVQAHVAEAAEEDAACDGSDEVEFVEEGDANTAPSMEEEERLEYDYSGEPEEGQQQQSHHEEDPVPAAAPNPFV